MQGFAPADALPKKSKLGHFRQQAGSPALPEPASASASAGSLHARGQSLTLPGFAAVPNSEEQAVPTAAVPDVAAALAVSRAAGSEERLGPGVASAAAWQAELVPQESSTAGNDQVNTVLSCLPGPLYLTLIGYLTLANQTVEATAYAWTHMRIGLLEPCNKADALWVTSVTCWAFGSVLLGMRLTCLCSALHRLLVQHISHNQKMDSGLQENPAHSPKTGWSLSLGREVANHCPSSDCDWCAAQAVCSAQHKQVSLPPRKAQPTAQQVAEA